VIAQVVHPRERPNRLDRYLLEILRQGDPQAPLEVLAGARTFQTDHGWRGRMIATTTALAARYDMLQFVAGVVLIATSAEGLARAMWPIESYLTSARPDFSDEHACLTTLWCRGQAV
jgi:hypothetical protein